jgi:hypothetical protein
MKARAKILRWPICILASLWLLPAAADCEDEAYAARTSIFRSGPFYFHSMRFSANYRIAECGEVDPFKAEHTRSCDPTDGRREYMRVRNRSWTNDGFGWLGSSSSVLWSHGPKLPSLSLSRPFSRVICHGRVKIDDRELNKYEFVVQTQAGDRVSYTETVFFDLDAGRAIRFETTGPLASNGSVTHYRYDPLIQIEPPNVDLEKRWARSVRHFHDVVQDTEPACREEVLIALRRGRAASFQYDLRRLFHTHLLGMRGVFVAPGSIHNRMLSPRFEMEFIAIGEQVWKRAEPQWVETERVWKRVGPQWVEAPEQRGEVDWVIGELMPNPKHVGHVQCLGKVTISGREYRVYNYDLYRVWESALKYYDSRRLLIDNATGLPTQTVGLSRGGARSWVEMRWYEPGLAIELPTGSDFSQDPARPLRSMTDEEHRRAMLPEQFAQEISPK